MEHTPHLRVDDSISEASKNGKFFIEYSSLFLKISWFFQATDIGLNFLFSGIVPLFSCFRIERNWLAVSEKGSLLCFS